MNLPDSCLFQLFSSSRVGRLRGPDNFDALSPKFILSCALQMFQQLFFGHSMRWNLCGVCQCARQTGFKFRFMKKCISNVHVQDSYLYPIHSTVGSLTGMASMHLLLHF